jgi:hypothetical protein
MADNDVNPTSLHPLERESRYSPHALQEQAQLQWSPGGLFFGAIRTLPTCSPNSARAFFDSSRIFFTSAVPLGSSLAPGFMD